MARKTENPAGEGGVRNCLLLTSDDPDYTPIASDIKHQLRLSRLQRRFGLNGPRAELVARLIFDGGAR